MCEFRRLATTFSRILPPECPRWLRDISSIDVLYLSIYPTVLGTVGAPHDLATISRHSSRSSALLKASLSSKPVQSRMLYFHRFLCLPLLLPPRTVPWRTLLASPEALVTCPYHFILRLLQWTRVLRRVQWLSESCFAPLRW